MMRRSIVVAFILVSTNVANGGTVAHWVLDSGGVGTTATSPVLDSSANQLHGQPFVGPIFDGSCSKNIGLHLDGIDDRVFVPDHPAFELTQSLTLEAVIRLDALPAGQFGQVIFRGDKLSGKDPYFLTVMQDGRLLFHVHAKTEGSSVVSPTTLPIGEVIHVAGTLDDATGIQSLYVGGDLVASKTTAIRPYGKLNATALPGIGIGQLQHTSPHQFFNGLILEARISDQALGSKGFVDSCCGGELHSFGSGCPGEGGVVPSLNMVGCAVGGGALTLAIEQAKPATTAIILLGLFETSVPAEGTCTLNIAPVFPAAFPIPLGGSTGAPGSGVASVGFLVPPGIQPATVKIQAFIADDSNAWGYSATNGFSVSVE